MAFRRQMKWIGPALLFASLALAGCDPGAYVAIRNEIDRDYILAWVQAGTDGDTTYADSVVLPAQAEGVAYSVIGGPIDDWTFLLLTPTCDIVSAIRASGTEIKLVVTSQQGWLDRTEELITGEQLARSTECITP